MKTSELTGDALDWAVAKCEGIEYTEGRCAVARCRIGADESTTHRQLNGRKVVPIIERESIFVLREQSGFKGRRLWAATSGASKAIGLNDDSVKLYRDAFYFGPAPLIAAMRCYVASRLGDEVELPEDLDHEDR
jgi:hypothetical protein